MMKMWLFCFHPLVWRSSCTVLLFVHSDQSRVIFTPVGNTPFSVAAHIPHPSVYSLFCLWSHTRGFRSNHGIRMVDPQTARAFMFLTSCPCVRCLFCWTHDVVWRSANLCCGESVLESRKCINTRVILTIKTHKESSFTYCMSLKLLTAI